MLGHGNRVRASQADELDHLRHRLLHAATPQSLDTHVTQKQFADPSLRGPPTFVLDGPLESRAAPAKSIPASLPSGKGVNDASTVDQCTETLQLRPTGCQGNLSSQQVEKQRPRRTTSEALSARRDEKVFRNFWPLLDDSRDYARMSGCRFRSRSFDGVGGEIAARVCDDAGPEAIGADGHSHTNDADLPLAAARARAAPSVYRFAERLRARDPALLEELEKAYRIVMSESVRNSMVSTCQVLELWPPSPTPEGVLEDDCAFEDVSAPIPVIAQRLYNDERRRQKLTFCKGDLDPMRQRAMMAIFIVEFAAAAGGPMPEMPDTYEMMLRDFKSQAVEWEETHEVQKHPALQLPSISLEQDHLPFFGGVPPKSTFDDPKVVVGQPSQDASEPSPNSGHPEWKSKRWPAEFASKALAAVFGRATRDRGRLTSCL